MRPTDRCDGCGVPVQHRQTRTDKWVVLDAHPEPAATPGVWVIDYTLRVRYSPTVQVQGYRTHDCWEDA